MIKCLEYPLRELKNGVTFKPEAGEWVIELGGKQKSQSSKHNS